MRFILSRAIFPKLRNQVTMKTTEHIPAIFCGNHALTNTPDAVAAKRFLTTKFSGFRHFRVRVLLMLGLG